MPLIPSEQELRDMLKEGQTLYQISRQFNMTIKEVHKLEIEYGITRKNKIPRPTKQDLESMYIDERMTMYQISREFDVNEVSVHRWIHNFNIPTVGRMGAKVPRPPKEVLERMYIYDGMTQEEIGKEFGVHWHTVGNWLRDYNISTVGRPGSLIPIPPKDDLLNYIGDGLNQHQIAKECKVSDWKIFDWCEKLGIPGMVNSYRCTTPEHTEWRDAVFARDNYICQECGLQGDLQAHHIVPYCDHPEIAYELENGITLCKECHLSVKGREYEYIEQFAAITQRP